MKDFCKWLGVNEKVAKLIVWLFIGMSMLIIFNVALESMGLPFYKITVDNLAKIEHNELISFVLSCILSVLNFYSVILLVFRTSEYKKIFKYAILYLLLNILITNIFTGNIGNIILQVFIFVYILIFCYLYSNKNKKIVLYGIYSYIVNAFVQFICYLCKLRFVDYSKMNGVGRFLTSIDFLLIIFTIIHIKEIIIKKKEGVKQ